MIHEMWHNTDIATGNPQQKSNKRAVRSTLIAVQEDASSSVPSSIDGNVCSCSCSGEAIPTELSVVVVVVGVAGRTICLFELVDIRTSAGLRSIICLGAEI
jgi:hypothetical protein